jgi:hypothetical protein
VRRAHPTNCLGEVGGEQYLFLFGCGSLRCVMAVKETFDAHEHEVL